MSKNKNLTLIFNHFEKEHLGKDVFLVPYYLGKTLDYDVTIVYPRTATNKDFPKEIKGVRLIPLKFNKRLAFFPLWRTWNFYMYLIRNAYKIDLLMRFHYTVHSKLMVVLYKLLNPKGTAYVKLDADADVVKKQECYRKNSFRHKFSDFLSSKFLKKVDIVSCETFACYEILKNSSLLQYKFGNKLKLMPNGFDEELLQSLNIVERNFKDKENLIITVGRLGTYQKNTEMFLRALAQVDLKDWKVCLIGPIEKKFQSIIDNFFKQYPEKIGKVIFTGPIYDKKDLWEYYNKAKVFVLTSRFEGYPIVYPEAKRFANYIVSTSVSACEDIIENGKYGKSISIDNDKELALILSEIVNKSLNINVYQDFDVNSLSWESVVKLLEL